MRGEVGERRGPKVMTRLLGGPFGWSESAADKGGSKWRGPGSASSALFPLLQSGPHLHLKNKQAKPSKYI